MATRNQYEVKNATGGTRTVIVKPGSEREQRLVSEGAVLKSANGEMISKNTKTYGDSNSVNQPTVLSDVNIRDNVIPDLQQRANRLIGTRTTPTTQTGNGVDSTDRTPSAPTDSDAAGETNVYDELYQSILGDNSVTDEDQAADSEFKSILQELKRTNDQVAQSSISAIEGVYNVREAQMKKSIASEGAQMRGALRLAGARYAPGSTGGLMTAQEQQGILKLAQLDAEELSLINEVRSAQREGNMELLEKQLERAETKATEKREARQKLFDTAIKRNEEIAAQTIKASRDQAVSDLVDQGITDTSSIIRILNEGGGDFSLKEIDDALKIVNPDPNLTGLTADYKTYLALKDAGDPAISGLDYLDFVRAINNAERKPTSTDEDDIKLAADDRRTLLGAGFTSPEIKQIENDIQKFGIDRVLEGVENESQKKAIQKVYGGEDTEQFLDREYFKGLFTTKQLETAAAEAGFGDLGEGPFNLKDVDTEAYLDSIEKMINAYRNAGYTDKEILNKMQ